MWCIGVFTCCTGVYKVAMESYKPLYTSIYTFGFWVNVALALKYQQEKLGKEFYVTRG